MVQSNLIEPTHFDPKACVRPTTYADTIITDKGKIGRTITAIRFGGYPEVVRAMSDAIYSRPLPLHKRMESMIWRASPRHTGGICPMTACTPPPRS